MSHSTKSRQGRLGQFDALRGLAALSVLLGHFSSVNIDESKVWHVSRLGRALFAPIRPFASRREPALLFSLPIELVLALPSFNSRPLSHTVFITRRIVAAVLIVLSFSFAPFRQFLLSRIPQYFRKLLYSTSLVHSTVVCSLLYLMSKRIPPEVIFAIDISLVLLIATARTEGKW